MELPALKIEVQIYNCLRQKVMEQYLDLDDETIRDTLEGITDLHEMIAAVIRSALVDEALCAGLRLRADDMKQRLSRLDERAAKKRALALEAMTEVGLSKLEQPDFTASARAGTPALVVISEDTIPRSTGFRSHRGSIVRCCSASSSAAIPFPVLSSATRSRCSP